MAALPPLAGAVYLVASPRQAAKGGCPPELVACLSPQETYEAVTVAQFVQQLDLPPAPQAGKPCQAVAGAHWSTWHSEWCLDGLLQAQGLAAPAAAAQAPRLWQALLRLRRAGVTPAELRRAVAWQQTAAKAGSPPQAVAGVSPASGAQLAALYAAYEAARAQARATDEASAWQRARTVAAQPAWPLPWQQVHTVWVDASVPAVGAPLALLRAVAQSGRRVVVGLAFAAEDPAANPYHEAILGALEALAAQAGEATCGSEIEVVQLAARQPPTQVVQCLPGHALVQHIVRTVQGWVRAGTPPSDIAVVLPPHRPPHFLRRSLAAALQDGLAAAGLAVRGGEATALQDTPLGHFLRQLFALVGAQGTAVGDPPGEGRALPLVPLAALWAALGRPLPRAGHARADSLADRSPAQVAALLLQLGERRLPPALLQQLLASLEEVSGADAQAMTSALFALAEDVTRPYLAATSLAELCGQVAATAYGLPAEAAALAQGSATLPVLAEALALLRAASQGQPKAAAPAPLWPQAEVYLRRMLARTPLPTSAPAAGVALYTPAQAPVRGFRRVLLAGVHEAVFPRGEPDDDWLPRPLIRALQHVGAAWLAPSASVAAEAPLAADAKERADWCKVLAMATDALQVVVLAAADGSEPALPAVLREARFWAACEPAATPAAAPPEIPFVPPPWQQPAQTQPHLEALLCAVARQHRPLLAHLGAEGVWVAERLRALLVRLQDARLPPRLAERVAAQWLAAEHATGALDTLGKCRFAYFAGTMLRLPAMDKPSLAPSPRVVGTALHRALHRILEDWRSAPGGLAGRRQQPERAMAEAEAVWQQHLATILPPEELPAAWYAPTCARVWQAVAHRLRQDLADVGGAEPWALEYAFGRARAARPLEVPEPPAADADATAAAAPSPARVARVTGQIDRVDWRPAAPEVSPAAADAPVELLVYDYKSRAPSRVAHRHLQLGLYGLVAARMGTRPLLGIRAAWLPLLGGSKPEDLAAKHVQELPPDLAGFQAQVQQNLWQRLAPLLAGDVAPDPERADVCKTCSYQDLCHFPYAEEGAADGPGSGA